LYQDLLKLRENATDQDKVFGWGRFRVWQIVKKAGKRVGVEGVSPHWFRHAHATHALARGASLKLVSETLGHSSITITDRYLHIRPDESSGKFLKIE
jgi:integrase/recombinase XerD